MWKLKLNLPAFILGFWLVTYSAIGQNTLSGTIFIDSSNNCVYDAGELVMPAWPILIKGAGEEFVCITSDNGEYSITLPDGEYTMEVISLSPSLFDISECIDVSTINLNSGSSQQLDVPVFEDLDCAEVMVDLVMTESLPGDTAKLYVNYWNVGAAPAVGTNLQLQLGNGIRAPEALNSQIWVGYSEGLIIPIDSIPVGSSRHTTEINVVVADDIPYDQNLYANVSSPVQPGCLDSVAWDSSNVVVYGECIQGDSTYFKIKNIGPGDMSTSADFIIVEDDLLVIDNSQFQLDNGDSLELKYHNPTAFLRLYASQTPGNPSLGDQTYLVDICSGSSALGVVPGDIYVEDSTVSQQNLTQLTTAMEHPAVLEIYPVGVFCGVRQIHVDDRLDFVLRARNLSESNNQSVTFSMTLPEELEFSTFRPGAGTSEYNVALNHGVLTWNMANPMNAYGSSDQSDQAIVKFSMKPDTTVESSAILDSYFEVTIGSETFSSQMISQTIVSTLCVAVDDSEELEGEISEVTISPNPTRDRLIISSESKVQRIEFISVDGRMTESASVNSTVDVSHLPKGIYIVSIETESGLVRKKLVISK